MKRKPNETLVAALLVTTPGSDVTVYWHTPEYTSPSLQQAENIKPLFQQATFLQHECMIMFIHMFFILQSHTESVESIDPIYL